MDQCNRDTVGLRKKHARWNTRFDQKTAAINSIGRPAKKGSKKTHLMSFSDGHISLFHDGSGQTRHRRKANGEDCSNVQQTNERELATPPKSAKQASRKGDISRLLVFFRNFSPSMRARLSFTPPVHLKNKKSIRCTPKEDDNNLEKKTR